MAGNRVVLTFVGEDGPLRRTVDKLDARLASLGKGADKLGSGLFKVVKPLALMGAAGGAIHTLAGVAAAGQQLLPIALLLPGALLAGAAAMATFKLATAGFSDALSGDAEAMAKLAPSARATAEAVRSFSGRFDGLKRSVQDRLFAGFADDVKALGAQYFPILESKLPKIAGGFNEMGRSVAFALSRPLAGAQVGVILDNTSKLLHNARNAAGGFTTGLLGLGSVGSTYLPRLGTAIDGVAQKFQRWVDKGTGDGSIRRMIDGAIAGFKDLGAIAGNVGSILGSIWKGLSGGSGAASPLSTLRDLTTSLAAFFKTAEAQGPLQALGQTMAVLGGVVKDVVLAGLKFLGPLIVALAPIVQELGKVIGNILTTAFRELGPPITKLIDKLRPVLIPVLRFLGTVITDYVIPALASFIGWLADHVDDVEDFAQNSVLAFLSIGSSVLSFVSDTLGGMQRVFQVLSYIPGSFGQAMGRAAQSTGEAKGSVDRLRGTVDLLHSKAVDVRATTLGKRAVDDLVRSIGLLPASKTITINAVTNAARSISGIFGGGRAVGGTVNKGSSYLVGERGPEILTMGGSGYVTPNHRLGGGAGAGGQVQVAFTGNTSDALATVIMGLIRTGKIQVKAA